MPRRIGDLFESVVSFHNLLGAARRAKRGCGATREVCAFFYNLEPELLALRRELLSGSYAPGPYRYFTIYDPKVRTIAVAPFRDRVMHHAVVGVLTPIFEKRFIHDSYATRKGKGTHAAVLRSQTFLRRRPWFLKADIRKYFDSVDHSVLFSILERKIKDRRLLALLKKVTGDSLRLGKGLPIGNLTSQFLANVYLDPLDHLVKERLRVKCYLRYMDDFVLFADAKVRLLEWRDAMEEFLSEKLKLGFKPGGVWLNRSSHGLSFLGMRVFPGVILLRGENRRRSVRRMRSRLRSWESGRMSEERLSSCLTSIVGWLRHFGTGLSLPGV